MEGASKMNADIKAWGKGTIGDLKQEFSRLQIVHAERSPSPSPSVEALINRFGQRQGLINKVSFKFPRHMVFVHKGVGKGVPSGFTGSTTRRPKEWFNPIMEKDIEKLADTVANNQADIIVSNLLIK